MAATTIEIEKTIMAAEAKTATVTLSASPWSSIAGTLVEDAETTTGPLVAVEVIIAAEVAVAIIVAAAEAVAIIVAEVAVATLAVAVAEVITAAAVEVTTVVAVVAEISVAAVVAEISVAQVVVVTSAVLVATLAVAEETSEVEVTSKEVEVTSMGVAVTSEAAEETSGVAVVAASAVELEANSATMTTTTLVTEEADLTILSKDRKDTIIKIEKTDHSRNTATDPGITTTTKMTTAGSHEAECVVEAEEAHAATLAGHPEMEAVCMATSHPAAARTMTMTIASLLKSSKAVACAVEVTCV